jgi:GNAT superfamily N-acetyltransferase
MEEYRRQELITTEDTKDTKGKAFSSIGASVSSVSSVVESGRVFMNLTITEADLSNPAVCADVVDVLNSYAADPIGGGVPLSAEVRARLPLGLRGHPTTLVLLARVEGKSIGVAVCFWGFSTFHARRLLNIHDLAVTPEWRGKGAGTALLDAIETRALERGCCKLTLEVQDDNRRARALYDRCGFGDAVVGSARPTRFLCKLLPVRGSTWRE